MSKAFDTVNRKTLLEKLEPILDDSEMRMMYLLIADVKYRVRVENTLSEEEIDTNVGVAQGDCLSALLFIFYLAHFVHKFPGTPNREDFKDEILWSEPDWLIDRDVNKVIMDPKYAVHQVTSNEN